MVPNHIITFFQDLYKDKTDESLLLESRQFQLVSKKVMSKDEAKKTAQKFSSFLPKNALETTKIGYVESRKLTGKYRLVITSPANLYDVFVQLIIGRLNKTDKNKMEQLKVKDLIQTVWEQGCKEYNQIGYRSRFSQMYIPSDGNIKALEANKQEIEQYNSYLTNKYPGLMIHLETHKSGDVYYIEVSYEAYKIFQTIPSLRQLVIGFFKENPYLFTEEAKRKLPSDIIESMADLEPLPEERESENSMLALNK